MSSDPERPAATSVIVPHYKTELRLLRECVAALLAQEEAEGDYEIILVDNSPEFVLANCFSNENGRLKIVHHARPGGFHARNHALGLARGSLIAFTDADCVPHPDWLKNGVKALRHFPEVAMFGGKIQHRPKNGRRLNLVETCDSLIYLRQEFYLREDHFAVTANLFTRREVFDQVGLFDGRRKSGGDREWGRRVWAAGLKQRFCPEAIIDHFARGTFRQLARKARRIRGGELLAVERIDVRDAMRDAWQEGRWKFRILRKNRTRFGSFRLLLAYLCIAGLQMVIFRETLRLKRGGQPRR